MRSRSVRSRLIGDDSIGRGIVETLSGHRSPAVLMQNHGVFTIGPDARAAVKAAVMCEDVARTVHVARQLGEPVALDSSDDRCAVRPLSARLRPTVSGRTRVRRPPLTPKAAREGSSRDHRSL